MVFMQSLNFNRNKEGKMARCTGIGNLEVHYKKLDGGAGLDNTIVLCRKCLLAVLQDSPEEINLPVFDEMVRLQAMSRAGYQCECERTNGCHNKQLTMNNGQIINNK